MATVWRVIVGIRRSTSWPQSGQVPPTTPSSRSRRRGHAIGPTGTSATAVPTEPMSSAEPVTVRAAAMTSVLLASSRYLGMLVAQLM